MSLNMSDPAAVMTAYGAIVDYELNWLLLHYTNDYCDELGLHSYGSEGLEEMKTHISDLNSIYIGFYREEIDQNPGFVLFNYIPPSVSAVQRAQALVHSRRVGIIFKRHQIVYTVDDLSFLTVERIHEAITTPHSSPPSPSPPPKPLPQTMNGHTGFVHDPPPPKPPKDHRKYPTPPSAHRPPGHPSKAVSRSVSEPYSHVDDRVPSPPPLAKGGSLFTNILRRKKVQRNSLDKADLPPPPTPPKDQSDWKVGPPKHLDVGRPQQGSQPSPALHRQRSRSFSEYAVVSHLHGRQSPEYLDLPPEPPSPPPRQSSEYFNQLREKWTHESASGFSSDPAERARQRRELAVRREREEQKALAEEAERQRKIKLEKELFLKREEEEERQRKKAVELEIQRITAERRRKEEQERLEEERKRREIEERKRLDRERRLEEHRRLEEWREEQRLKAERAASEAEQARKREEADRARRIQEAEARVRQSKREADLSGWVNVLNSDSLSWRQRFYKCVGNTLYLYRKGKELILVDEVALKGAILGLREWNEGHEDLKSIPHSFAVEFKDGRPAWSFYCDSEGDKFKLLGVLKMCGEL